MGKEHELLEAARSGNVAVIEKILSPRNKWTGPLQLPLVQTLLKGPHPNCQDATGMTPLHYAALNNHKDVVEVLLKLQASTNIPDQKGCYPLHLAAWRGNAGICQVLLSHGPSLAKVNAQNLEGDTALHSAAQYGHTSVVQVLLQKFADSTIKNSKGDKALDLAILFGRIEAVQLLLGAAGLKASFVGAGEKSPLHLAAKNGNKQVVQILLDAGFDVNYKTDSGTALHEASVYGRLDVVKLLLERGIDYTITDCDRKTAVDILNDLKNPASLELRRVILDHIEDLNKKSSSPTVVAQTNISDQDDYDYVVTTRPVIPDSLSVASRESVTSVDSAVFENACSTLPGDEENIYDHLPAGVRLAALSSAAESNKKLSVCSSFNKNDPQIKFDTIPKKPPRKKPPPTAVMVKDVDNADSIAKDTQHDNATSMLDISNPVVGPKDVASSTRQQHQGNDNVIDNRSDNNNDYTTTAVKENIDNINCNVGSRQPSSADTESSRGDISSTNQRPPSLDFENKRSSLLSSEDVPLSPTSYKQPPTPEHPPPSPKTAVMGIQEKINPAEKRKSRDMETITEIEFLGKVKEPPVDDTVIYAVVNKVDRNKPVATTVPKMPQSATSNGVDSSVGTNADSSGSVVVDMRNPYHGLTPKTSLTHGAVSPNQRRIKSQILDKVYSFGSKRISTPAPFDPLMERIEEQNQTSSSPNKTNPKTSSEKLDPSLLRKKSECCSPTDETEEWAKIEDLLITSITGGLDSDMLVKEFDQRMSSVLLNKDRTFLGVGDWLTTIDLPQYENILIANGFDDVDFLGPDILDDGDLFEIGVTDKAHRLKILDSSSKLLPLKPLSSLTNSVRDWLESLRLSEYYERFEKHGLTDVNKTRTLRDVQLSSVLEINSLGHRKRILASLQLSSLDSPSNKQIKTEKRAVDNTSEKLKSEGLRKDLDSVNLFKDYTHLAPHKDSRLQSLYHSQPVNSEMLKAIQRSSIQSDPYFNQWHHRPEVLITGCCNYTVQYLGSTLVTLLDGTESTKASISRLKKSTAEIAKVPSIVLSISYTGVKFIDAKSRRVICEHEIGNIFCACQDGDCLNYFAYITRDLATDKHYCHVFSVSSTVLATEIILTLGEAFEVAYQIAVHERGLLDQTSSAPQDNADKISTSSSGDSIPSQSNDPYTTAL